MIKMYKYPINKDRQKLDLPKGSVIHSVENQYGNVVLYALINTATEERETYEIMVYSTGQEFIEEGQEFLGTVNLQGGQLMFHVFYKKLEYSTM